MGAAPGPRTSGAYEHGRFGMSAERLVDDGIPEIRGAACDGSLCRAGVHIRPTVDCCDAPGYESNAGVLRWV